MAKRKITEPALLEKGEIDTFQDKMDRLIGKSPFEERNQLRSQLLDETFLKVIGKEKEKELQNRLNQLLNRDFFMAENKEYLAKRKDYLDKIKFEMEKDALDKRGETIQILNERQNKQDGGLLDIDSSRMRYVEGELSSKDVDKLIDAQINYEVKLAKEYGDDYFNSGTGFLTGRFFRAIGDSGQGRRVFDDIRKINNDMGDIYTNEELESKINKGYKAAGLSYRFKLPKNLRTTKATGGLQNPEKADLDNDGELSSYEKARGKAIEENMRETKQEGGTAIDNQMADMMPEEKTEEQKAIENAQAPDEEMEENYVDFLIDEALDDEEEKMLMEELQANPKLSMLFDKVMEVAMEFSGSGPVEGPGSEVSDSIPARLSDGEFVFTAKAVEEIGADNLMAMMKQAEAQADQRQTAQDGGLMEEEETVMPVQQEPVRQDIRVTKETVGSQASMQEEEDLIGDELKKQMLSGRPHVRS